MTKKRLKEIIALAKRWVAASPKKPFTRDMSEHAITEEVPAFTDILGFRGTDRMDMDKSDIEAEAEAVDD